MKEEVFFFHASSRSFGEGCSLGPYSCSSQLVTQEAHEAGSWWTPTQAATPEQTAGRHRESKTIITEQEGCSGARTIADYVLSIHHQSSCATSHLLQARGEMLSILVMRNVEMVF
jgi:hypothetical protein